MVVLDVLDGAMITLAMFTVNISHPGWLIPEAWSKTPQYTVQPETLSMEQLDPLAREV